MPKERTDVEILAKIKEIEAQEHLFEFVTADLKEYLSYEAVKPFLKEGVTEKDWTHKPKDRDSILKQMKDYMTFAWDKANNERGLSASRTMDHYTAWIWMLGDEEVDIFGNIQEYEFYGKPQLKAICDHYGWDDVNDDDGVRSNG